MDPLYLLTSFGSVEGFPGPCAFPTKIGNVAVSPLYHMNNGDTFCSFCFPHGRRTRNAGTYDRKWKNYR